MGWFQRNPRIFYVVGISVMVLSLGAVFLGRQTGSQGGTPSQPVDTAAADAQTDTATSSDADADTTAAPPGDQPIQRLYSAPPPFEIDPSHEFRAVIRTEKGDVILELLPEEAPGLVNNFVFLVRQNFYDGLTFHRVVPGFVAQAGDPTATGFGGAGYDLPEDKNDLLFEAGVISMAKQDSASPVVDSSQFFITLEPTPHLNGAFTVFGRVVEGLNVLRTLTERDPAQSDQPGDRILSIEIVEVGSDEDS